MAQAVTNQAPDPEHLRPMMSQVLHNCGRVPVILSGDAGYWSEENAKYCQELGIDPYLAVGRQKHGARSPPEQADSQEIGDLREQMRQKLQSEKGAAIYARRKAIVEPPYGQIKSVRGIRAFLLRGVNQVRAEWSLICTGHNLLKLWRAGKAATA